MPYKSKRQQRFFHAAAADGEIPESTVKEWDEATNRGPGFKGLPETRKARGGMVRAPMRLLRAAFGIDIPETDEEEVDEVPSDDFTPEERYATSEEKRFAAMAGGGEVKRRPRLGSGKRFSGLERRIAARGDVDDPRAVAAAIGRAKYGAKRMGELSHHEERPLRRAFGGSIKKPSFGAFAARKARFGGRG